ncbi:MAG: MAPEG family protein [Sedimentitalea sp.]
MVNAIALGAAGFWSVALIWGTQSLGLPFLPAPIALPGAFMAPGLVLAAMVARCWASDHATDRDVLRNTITQAVLAFLIWPFVALTLGGAITVVMGFAFALSCAIYWLGAHVGAPLRQFGFAATFFTTVLAAVWSVVAWMG